MKSAVGPLQAAIMTIVLMALLVGAVLSARIDTWPPWPIFVYGLLTAFVLMSLARKKAEPPTPAGRTWVLIDDKLRQRDEAGKTCAEIDLTTEFSYRFLENEQDENSRVRVYQADRILTFFTTDPGAPDAIRNALQHAWPSRSTARIRIREGRI